MENLANRIVPDPDTGLFTEPAKYGDPVYDIRAVIAYARSIGKETDELTKGEVKQFIIKYHD